MDATIGVAIIGCGVVAPSHVESYMDAEGVEIRAFCDLIPERLDAYAQRYPEAPARRVADLDEILEDPAIHAVSVCTGHGSHEEIVLKALQAGKHVMCEKALTTNHDSLRRMLEASRNSGLVTAGIFQHRFDQVYRSRKSIIGEQRLGQLLNVSAQHQCLRLNSYYEKDAWRGTWAGEGGSLLINQSIHFLDLLAWMTGGVASVSAYISNLAHVGIIETEDTASAAMVLRNGALASFIATSSSNREWASAFQVVGTEGHIFLDSGRLLSCSHKDPEKAEAIREELEGIKELSGVEGAKSYYGPSHPAQIHDFIAAIREGRKPYVSFEDAAEAVRLVLAIYESAKEKKPVRLA